MWQPNVTNSSVPRLPNYSSGIYPSGAINASNLAYMRGGISTDPTAGVTGDLLNPNWGPAVYDTEKRGAELAVGGGYSGSPLAGYQTSRMRAADIERRAALANSLLSGAASRVPNPANQENLLGMQQQQDRFNQDLAFQKEKFAWDQQQQNLKTQGDAGYRYQSGRGQYSPLPQYMKAGMGDSYTITPWGATQSGPTGITQRYRY